MKKVNIKSLVTTAILMAICLILGLTPIGYLKIGPIDVTLMCIPVIIGTLTQGFKTGLFLGLVFGATSLYQALTAPSALVAPLISYSVPLCCIPIFVARLLIPIVVHFSYKLAKRLKNDAVGIGISAFLGTLTNTVFYLGLLLLLFSGILATHLGTSVGGVLAVLAGVAGTNGVAEAVLAVIVCTPVVKALRKIYDKK